MPRFLENTFLAFNSVLNKENVLFFLNQLDLSKYTTVKHKTNKLILRRWSALFYSNANHDTPVPVRSSCVKLILNFGLSFTIVFADKIGKLVIESKDKEFHVFERMGLEWLKGVLRSLGLTTY